MPRPYRKKNAEYWDNLSNGRSQSENQSENKLTSATNFEPELIGESLYQSVSSRESSSRQTSTRKNQITKTSAKERFSNIDSGLLPYEYSSDSVSVRDAVVLCQKAYFNVAVFRTTLDLLSEFANSEIYLKDKTGSSASRKFIKAWFKKIKLNDLKEQHF